MVKRACANAYTLKVGVMEYSFSDVKNKFYFLYSWHITDKPDVFVGKSDINIFPYFQ